MSDERTQLLIDAGLTPNDFCPICWSKVKRILNWAKENRNSLKCENARLRQNIIACVSFLLGVSGVAMAIISYGYKLAIVLFLIFTSHNIERHLNK